VRISRQAPVWLAVLSLSTAADARIQAWAARIHPSLKSGQIVIRKVVILPPQIDFTSVSMKGSQGMPAESDRLAEAFSAALAKELSARGVQVSANATNAPVTDQAKYALADIQSKYDNIRVQLRRKPLRVDRGQMTMGDVIAGFAPAKGCDAVVLVRGTAIKATRFKSVAMVVGLGALSGFQGDVALVDPRTGDVLVWARVLRTRDLSERPDERLGNCIRDALAEVPFPVRPSK